MQILDRGAALLREHTGQSAFNGYQDKNHRRAWEQVAAIYKAFSELGIRYMVVPPGNRLEALKGSRVGQHSIRINDQWRICFRWESGAHEVEIVDYH